MDKIGEIVSSLGIFRNNTNEGDCFGEHSNGGGSVSYNPFVFVENNKKNFILLIVVLLLGFIAVYMFYGDETETVMNSLVDNIQQWLGTTLLGAGYLTSQGEFKINKILDAAPQAPPLDAALEVDVNEMLMV